MKIIKHESNKKWSIEQWLDGSVCSTSGSYPKKTMKPYIFQDTLKFIELYYENNKAYFESLTTGANYDMFMKEFAKSVPFLKRGELEGTFKFCKRGTVVGINPIELEGVLIK